jgi:hypothetical protein
MKTRKDITFLHSSLIDTGQEFIGKNCKTKTKISINRSKSNFINGSNIGAYSGEKTGVFLKNPKLNTEGAILNFKEQKPAHFPAVTSAHIQATKPDFEEIDWEEVVENKSGQFTGQFSTDIEANNEANMEFFLEDKSDNIPGSLKPEKTNPHTKEEERALRRYALRSALKEEIGYLFYDETINGFFNELSKEYDGSPDKEIQLAVRKNLLRKIRGSFENNLEIKQAELYVEFKDNPIILSPRTRVLCSKYLDREFLKISRKEAFQYDEQKMIKVNMRGPKKIGNVISKLVGRITGDKTGALSTDAKTSCNRTNCDSEQQKPAHTPATKPACLPEAATLTEADPSNRVGTELALKTINTIKNSESNCTKNILSTVQENNLNNIFLDKRGCGGEKGKEVFVADTPTELLPVEKNSKFPENHPDGRPVFSTRAFKSLPRAKQIQIIGERLSEIGELFPTIDVEFQFDHWQDWMSAKGQSFKDYSAAFRNWLRKSLDFAAKNSASNPTKIYTETGAKFVTQEIFTNPAHVPFKKDVPRNPNLKRRPGIGGVE